MIFISFAAAHVGGVDLSIVTQPCSVVLFGTHYRLVESVDNTVFACWCLAFVLHCDHVDRNYFVPVRFAYARTSFTAPHGSFVDIECSCT